MPQNSASFAARAIGRFHAVPCADASDAAGIPGEVPRGEIAGGRFRQSRRSEGPEGWRCQTPPVDPLRNLSDWIAALTVW